MRNRENGLLDHKTNITPKVLRYIHLICITNRDGRKKKYRQEVVKKEFIIARAKEWTD